MIHPELKAEFPNWSDRYRQILKKWRALTAEKRQPYLQKARDNRSLLKMHKAQQVRLTYFKFNFIIYLNS